MRKYFVKIFNEFFLEDFMYATTDLRRVPVEIKDQFNGSNHITMPLPII